jgi:flagellar biosynthesis protein FliR
MDFSVIARFALLLVRPGMIVSIAPGIGGAFLPAQVKVGLTVLIALGLLPSVLVPAGAGGGGTMMVLIAREAAIGLSLAFVVKLLIAGAEFAGHLAGYQIGFSYGATIDPQSGVRSTMIATLYGSLATLAFLAINGHHMVLRALTASYAGVPMGTGQINESLVTSVSEMLGLVFIIGVRLAAPIIVVLLIVELGIGLISRSSPSLTFMVIGYPIRIVIGVFLIGVLIPTIPAVTASLLDTVLMMSARTAAAFR